MNGDLQDIFTTFFNNIFLKIGLLEELIDFFCGQLAINRKFVYIFKN